MNDSIVEEMRKYGVQFITRYNNISEICKVLKSKEQNFNREVVNRTPHYVKTKKLKLESNSGSGSN